jgi:hypothetical protein
MGIPIPYVIFEILKRPIVLFKYLDFKFFDTISGTKTFRLNRLLKLFPGKTKIHKI